MRQQNLFVLLSRLFRLGIVAILSFLAVPGYAGVGQLYDAKTGAMTNCIDYDTSNIVTCSDHQTILNARHQKVLRPFQRGDYRSLEKTYAQWCTGKDRFADGTWKIEQFRNGLIAAFAFNNGWDEALRKIKRWKKQYQGSAAAIYSETLYWYRYAWKARGSGYSDSVSPEAFLLFVHRLVKSAETFRQFETLSAAPCPEPYALLLDIAHNLSVPEQEAVQIYEPAAEAFPGYHPIHIAWAQRFEPKWGGSFEKYDDFVNSVVRRTAHLEGLGMYARLYQRVDSANGIPFKRGKVQPAWNRLRVGFEDLLQKHPKSTRLLGQYLSVACRSNDHELYRSIRARLGYHAKGVRLMEALDVCDLRHGWSPSMALQAQFSGKRGGQSASFEKKFGGNAGDILNRARKNRGPKKRI